MKISFIVRCEKIVFTPIKWNEVTNMVQYTEMMSSIRSCMMNLVQFLSLVIPIFIDEISLGIYAIVVLTFSCRTMNNNIE